MTHPHTHTQTLSPSHTHTFDVEDWLLDKHRLAELAFDLLPGCHFTAHVFLLFPLEIGRSCREGPRIIDYDLHSNHKIKYMICRVEDWLLDKYRLAELAFDLGSGFGCAVTL